MPLPQIKCVPALLPDCTPKVSREVPKLASWSNTPRYELRLERVIIQLLEGGKGEEVFGILAKNQSLRRSIPGSAGDAVLLRRWIDSNVVYSFAAYHQVRKDGPVRTLAGGVHHRERVLSTSLPRGLTDWVLLYFPGVLLGCPFECLLDLLWISS